MTTFGIVSLVALIYAGSLCAEPGLPQIELLKSVHYNGEWAPDSKGMVENMRMLYSGNVKFVDARGEKAELPKIFFASSENGKFQRSAGVKLTNPTVMQIVEQVASAYGCRAIVVHSGVVFVPAVRAFPKPSEIMHLPPKDLEIERSLRTYLHGEAMVFLGVRFEDPELVRFMRIWCELAAQTQGSASFRIQWRQEKTTSGSFNFVGYATLYDFLYVVGGLSSCRIVVGADRVISFEALSMND